MSTVYIETSVPSFYFETRKTVREMNWRRATRLWWDRYRDGYELFSSEVVLRELRAAPTEKSRQMLSMMEEIPLLPPVAGLEETVRNYLQHQLMPRNAEPDAFHLALASLHRIDFILTWNIRHLANANKTRHLQVLNDRMGLHVPIITTPELLTPEQAA